MSQLKPIQVKILYKLSTNSRIPENQLAKKLGISRQLLRYHIQRLKDLKLLLGYRTTFHWQKLGYRFFNVYLRIRGATQEIVEVARFAMPLEDVDWVSGMYGSYDLILSTKVRSFDEVTAVINTINEEFSHLHIEYDVHELLMVYKRNMSTFFLTMMQKKITQEQPTLTELKEQINTPYIINKNEKKILDHLSKNARASAREIAKRSGKSTGYVLSAIKRLEKEHVIRDYTIHFRFAHFNLHWYKVLLKFSVFNESTFYSYVCQSKHVLYADRLLGSYDASINLIVRSVEDLHEQLDNMRDLFGKALLRREVIIVGRTLKLKD